MNNSVAHDGNQPPKTPLLIPIGALLIFSSIFVPRLLDDAAFSMPQSSLRVLAFLASDVFRIFFFAGIGMVMIGYVRQRKRRFKAPRFQDHTPAADFKVPIRSDRADNT